MRKPPQIELRHLRYFLAVAKELHFGRAARKLGMAQPPLSQQIQQVEEIIGTALFERRPRVRLTAAGETMKASASALLDKLDQSVEKVRRAGQGLEGSLTIGFAASVLLTNVPRAIARYRDEFPDVLLDLRELSSANQIEALREGRIDLGILREIPPPESGLVYEILASEPFVAVLPQSHPCSKRRAVALSELAGDPFVMFPASVAPSLHKQVQFLFAEASFSPRVSLTAHEWLTIIGLVDSGAGVSLAPASFQRLKWGEVRYVPLSGTSRETSITICRANSPLSKPVDRFVEVLRLEAAFSTKPENPRPATAQ